MNNLLVLADGMVHFYDRFKSSNTQNIQGVNHCGQKCYSSW